MVFPEPTFLAPAANPVVKLLLAFCTGLLTHPANWVERRFAAEPVPAASRFGGHELEAEPTASPTATATTGTSTSTSTSTRNPSTPSAVFESVKSDSPCSEPEPLRLAGEGHHATVQLPVVVTFSVALGAETAALAFCCWALQRRGAERRSRQPLGASRIQVQ